MARPICSLDNKHKNREQLVVTKILTQLFPTLLNENFL
jgi:hypothetical protein